jgi:hypothetical protein
MPTAGSCCVGLDAGERDGASVDGAVDRAGGRLHHVLDRPGHGQVCRELLQSSHPVEEHVALVLRADLAHDDPDSGDLSGRTSHGIEAGGDADAGAGVRDIEARLAGAEDAGDRLHRVRGHVGELVDPTPDGVGDRAPVERREHVVDLDEAKVGVDERHPDR